MKIYYRKDTKEVVCFGQGSFNSPNIKEVSLTLTANQKDKIAKGYKVLYDDGLQFAETDIIKSEKEKDKMYSDFVTDLDKINKATDLSEIKTILAKLASKIYKQ